MKFNLIQGISILERTPATLRSLLEGLSEDWTHQNEGGESWSPYDIIGHLIHGELTDWVVRTEIILSDKADKTFETFDRFAQFENSKGKSLSQLLDEFGYLRDENIKKLKGMNISEDNLKLEGNHPQLGLITLKQLLATWVAHDLGHIYQISRVMAKQYKSEVGPWTQFLRVLQE